MARWLARVGAVLLTAAIVLVLVFDWNWLKGPLEAQASSALGRDVRIEGDLVVELGWTPVVRVSGLTIANADWGSRSDMLRVEQIEAAIELEPLLAGQIVLPFVNVRQPDVLLERRPDGRANWTFRQEGSGGGQGPPTVPRIGEIRIDQATLRYQGPARSAEANFEQIIGTRDRQTFELTAAGDVEVRPASGEARSHPVALDLTLQPGEEDGGRAIAAELTAGGSTAEAKGTIRGLDDLTAEVSLTSEDPNTVLALFGTTLAQPSALSADARLIRQGATVRVEDLVVDLGQSSIEGQIEANLGQARPKITADLQSRELRGEDFALAEGDGEPETETGQAPEGPLVDLELLPAIDLDLSFEGETIEVEDFSLTTITLGFHLRDHAAYLDASGDGRFRDAPLSFSIETGSEQNLKDPDARYPVRVDLDAGRTRATAEGTADQALDYTGLDVDVALEGPDLEQLGAILQIPLPETLPYSLSGKLRHRGTVWAVDDLLGEVGDSDLRGRFAVDIARDTPMITADLASQDLDLDDLGVIVGAPPATGPGETGRAPGEVEDSGPGRDRYVLPDDPFDLPDLRAVDAQVEFAGERVRAFKLPLERLDLDLSLEDGVMRVQPLDFDIGGGRLRAYMTLDATVQQLLTTYDVRASNIDLNDLLEPFEFEIAGIDVQHEGVGTLFGRARLETRGNSVHRAAASTDGNLALIMDGGSISALVLEAIGLDIGEALRLLLDGRDEPEVVPIRCLVASFAAEQGVMTSEALALDTPDSRIAGAGEIDLGDEQFELVFEAHPRDPSLLTASSPIRIKGSFQDLDVRTISEELEEKLLSALGLGVVLPVVGAAIPFIEEGDIGTDFRQCTSLIRDARAAARQDPRTDGG